MVAKTESTATCTIYQMGRAAWSRFALLRGGKSGTATRALGAVSAIYFGWKVLHNIDMVPTYKVALQ